MPDINIYTEMEKLMDITRDIPLQINWECICSSSVYGGNCTNNVSARVREVNLQGRRVLLRKARVPVTKENYRILQFLDFLKDIEQYVDENDETLSERIRKYIKEAQIKKKEVDCYIDQYPDKIYRYIYEMRFI